MKFVAPCGGCTIRHRLRDDRLSNHRRRLLLSSVLGMLENYYLTDMKDTKLVALQDGFEVATEAAGDPGLGDHAHFVLPRIPHCPEALRDCGCRIGIQTPQVVRSRARLRGC